MNVEDTREALDTSVFTEALRTWKKDQWGRMTNPPFFGPIDVGISLVAVRTVNSVQTTAIFGVKKEFLGTAVDAVQKLAGHSDVRLATQTYVHVQAEALRRTAGVLDRFGLEGEGGTGTSHRQTTAS